MVTKHILLLGCKKVFCIYFRTLWGFAGRSIWCTGLLASTSGKDLNFKYIKWRKSTRVGQAHSKRVADIICSVFLVSGRVTSSLSFTQSCSCEKCEAAGMKISTFTDRRRSPVGEDDISRSCLPEMESRGGGRSQLETGQTGNSFVKSRRHKVI